MSLNCKSGKLITKADSQAPPPEIRVQVDTKGSGTHRASSQAGIYGGFRHPVVPQLTLNMTVSQAPGSQMEWGIPEGNRRETGAPKGPGLVAAVCTSPAVNPYSLAASPRPPSPAPAGQLPNTGPVGRCTLWKLVSLFSLLRCSYLEVCRNLKGLSVPAQNCRRRVCSQIEGSPEAAL